MDDAGVKGGASELGAELRLRLMFGFRRQITHSLGSTMLRMKTYVKLLCLITLLSISSSQNAAADAANESSWDTFLTVLLDSIDQTGRFDITSGFQCRRNADATQNCFEANSRTSFRFKREPSNDVLSIDVVLQNSSAPKSDEASGYAGVTVSGLDEFLSLRSKFENWMRKHVGEDEDCQAKMSTDLPLDDPTQFFSIRNPKTDTAVILLFPNSDFEKAVSMGVNLDSENGQLVGTVLIINSLDIKCKRDP
jgi:hypothetical protein